MFMMTGVTTQPTFHSSCWRVDVFLLYSTHQNLMHYRLEVGDTLNGLILAEVAYGYNVMPILHQKYTQESAKLMPSDDTRLYAGDRLLF